jgi:hypothetical protein
MGLVDDILQGLPENSVLREKVGLLIEEMEFLTMEVVSLKDDLGEARGNIAKLGARVDYLNQIVLNEPVARIIGLIDVPAVRIMRLIADAEHSEPWAEFLAEMLGLHMLMVEYHLERLVATEFIYRNLAHDEMPHTYTLMQKGRDYLIASNLL